MVCIPHAEHGKYEVYTTKITFMFCTHLSLELYYKYLIVTIYFVYRAVDETIDDACEINEDEMPEDGEVLPQSDEDEDEDEDGYNGEYDTQ